VDDQFILGLITGEGSFSTNKRTRNGKFILRPIFVLGMRDPELIESIHSEIGLGNVSHRGDEIAQWSIHSLSEIKEFREFIENASSDHWGRSKKHKAFEIWSEIVDEMSARPSASITDKGEAIRLMEMSRRINDNYERKAIESDWKKRIEETFG